MGGKGGDDGRGKGVEVRGGDFVQSYRGVGLAKGAGSPRLCPCSTWHDGRATKQ